MAPTRILNCCCAAVSGSAAKRTSTDTTTATHHRPPHTALMGNPPLVLFRRPGLTPVAPSAPAGGPRTPAKRDRGALAARPCRPGELPEAGQDTPRPARATAAAP